MPSASSRRSKPSWRALRPTLQMDSRWRKKLESPALRAVRRQKAAASRLCVDKSVLALPAPRRVRDREHVRLVAKQPCLICGRRPADAHHLRFAQSRALGRKVSDEFTVPLCRGHHREVHRCGDEAAWWKKAGIDPTVPARVLWLESHPLPTASGNDQSTQRPIAGRARDEPRTSTSFNPKSGCSRCGVRALFLAALQSAQLCPRPPQSL